MDPFADRFASAPSGSNPFNPSSGGGQGGSTDLSDMISRLQKSVEGPQESQGLGPGLSYLAGQGLSTREMKDMGMSQRQVKNVRERESIAGIWAPTHDSVDFLQSRIRVKIFLKN